eukprot:scaffold118903_cov39-Phaeocystis_antarctica.AAC.1
MHAHARMHTIPLSCPPRTCSAAWGARGVGSAPPGSTPRRSGAVRPTLPPSPTRPSAPSWPLRSAWTGEAPGRAPRLRRA